MKKILILTVLFASLFSACKKDKTETQPCPTFWGQVFPSSLFFGLKQNGVRITDNTILDHLKLSYYKNGVKYYLDDFQRTVNEGGYNARDSGILATNLIALRSGDDKIKDYYLEFPNGDIDTLFVDYKRNTSCEADTSACQCLYQRNSVKYNGQTANYDPTITTQAVYLFSKP